MDKLASKNLCNEACRFCGLKERNEIKYGKLYKLGTITAHYYCVLLSDKIKQEGADNEGLLGFLLVDIKKELKRSKKIICCYCKKGHATINCCRSKCEKVFHLPCGLKNNSLHQFFDDFKNFCSSHKPVQNIPKKILKELKNSSKTCAICFDRVKVFNLDRTLWAPCCKKSLYHRKCIQKLALSEGYLFKCAICNNKKEFKKYMLRFGIYVPQRDASWELVPQAFEELLYKYDMCDADACKNPTGRQRSIENTIWEIILCKSCGSHGIHIACGNLKFSNPHWECETCVKVINSRLQKSKTCALEEANICKKSNDEFVKPTPGSSSNTLNNYKPYIEVTNNSFQSKKRKLSEEESLVAEKRPKYLCDSEDSESEFVDVETVDSPEVKTKAYSPRKGSSGTGSGKPIGETKNIEVIVLTDSDDDEGNDDDEVKVIKEIYKDKNPLAEQKMRSVLNKTQIIEIRTCISFCNKEEEITKERALVRKSQRLWQHQSMFYLKQ